MMNNSIEGMSKGLGRGDTMTGPQSKFSGSTSPGFGGGNSSGAGMTKDQGLPKSRSAFGMESSKKTPIFGSGSGFGTGDGMTKNSIAGMSGRLGGRDAMKGFIGGLTSQGFSGGKSPVGGMTQDQGP